MTNVARNVEFEIKSPIDDERDLKPLLEIAEFVGEAASTDTYWDIATHDLFKRGIFLRIRDNGQFDIKFNPDFEDIAHMSCDEYSYGWPLSDSDAKAVETFLAAYLPIKTPQAGEVFAKFELNEFVAVKKARKTFGANGVVICIDDVDGLGKFIEIEATDPGNAYLVTRYCEQAGLKNLKVGYVELLLRRDNFPLYKQGRYLLDEDKSRS
jgi:adenylate cyclase, class 2